MVDADTLPITEGDFNRLMDALELAGEPTSVDTFFSKDRLLGVGYGVSIIYGKIMVDILPLGSARVGEWSRQKYWGNEHIKGTISRVSPCDRSRTLLKKYVDMVHEAKISARRDNLFSLAGITPTESSSSDSH